MAWPTSTAEDALSGEGAETTAQDIWDRTAELRGSGSTLWWDVDTETMTSYQTQSTFEVTIPEHARGGGAIRVAALHSYSGAADGRWRIYDVASATAGTEQTTTGAAALAESVLTIPDDTWAGTTRSIRTEARVTTSGTITLDSRQLMANLRFTSS